MYKFLTSLVLALLGLVIIVFSLNNRGSVVIDFWPAPLKREIAVFTLVLVSLLIGVAWGGLVSWFSGGAVRRRAREQTRRAERMESELDALRANTKQPALPAPRDAA